MHGSATTTPEIRRAIQTSSLSIRALAARYGVNAKTVAKWKARKSPEDLQMGPHRARPKTLSPTEEATCIAFRIQAMLPLDDCLYALQLMFPHLTRSTLHRLFQRHGIQRLPGTPASQKANDLSANTDDIGHFYIDSADIRTGDGRANMFFAFDRKSKIAFARLYDYAQQANGSAFLDALIDAVPYKIGSVLTGTGAPFSGTGEETGNTASLHPFEQACRNRQINHILLPPGQPWSTDRRSTDRSGSIRARVSGNPSTSVQYESHDELREHFLAFFETYNFDRRLKALGGQTPFEFVCRRWKEEPERFRHDPSRFGHMLNG